MAIEVFSRYELKFMLDESQYKSVSEVIEKRMRCDSYSLNGSCYTISNVYYDTPDNRLISDALRHEGAYRYKVRLRTYDPTRSTAFLEIKKKYKGLTNKRRTSILIDSVNPMFSEGVFPEEKPFMNMQVTKELYIIGRSLSLVPKTVISYDRRAFFGKDPSDGDLRITFDKNIRSRRSGLDLRLGSHGEPLLEEGKWIMEVKVEKSVPLWVARLLSENGVKRVKFSKYGTEYKNYIQKNAASAAKQEA